jgi:O-antigen ligase
LYKHKSKINYIIIYISLYFIFFSANRTVLVILLTLLVFEFLYKRKNYILKKSLPALVLSGTILLTVTPTFLYQFNTGPVINSLMYRSPEKPEIFELESNYRVILWANILYVYNQSPITGVGNFNLYEYVSDAPSHSECKWLSLLARYGIAVFILFFFIYSRYLIALERNLKSEAWVSIMIILYMMFYGSFMEVYNMIFFVMLGINNISYLKEFN